MKNITIILICLLGISFTNTIIAQTDVEGLLFTQQNPAVTARGLGMGGAFASLGADFSAIRANPAGTAMYRSGEWTVSPSFHTIQTNSSFFGNGQTEFENKFQLPQMGAAFPGIERTHSGWKHAVGALGYHRIMDYSQHFSFSGTSAGSISNMFTERSNGFFPDELDPFAGGLAYDIDLIFNPDPSNPTEYAGDISNSDPVFKSQSVERSGGVHDIYLAYAANYGDRFYLGGSVHIPFLRFQQNSFYEEQDAGNDIPYFNQMSYDQELNVTGAGIQAKLGAIYRINSMFRVSLAYHTPISYRLNEQYQSSMSALIFYDDGSTNNPGSMDSPAGQYSYRFIAPMRINAGLSAVFGQSGLISFEADFVDYSRARFRFDRQGSAADANFERDLNQSIRNKYRPVINTRIGGELVLGQARLRAGYSLSADPFRTNILDISTAEHQISGGAGLRWESFYIDAALAYSFKLEEYYPYTTEFIIGTQGQPLVEQNITRYRAMLTFGVRF